MSKLFSDDNQNQNESSVDQIVKAKGENWKDIEVIAKGKLDADAHIEELNAQIAELQKSVAQTEKMEELLQKLEGTQNNSSSEQVETKPDFTQEEVASLVEETIQKRDASQKAKDNLKQVEDKMFELHGEESSRVVEKAANSLNLTKEYLEQVASTSPAAFMQLVGEADTNFNSTNSIRTESLDTNNSANTKNFAYYMKLKNDNPNLFSSMQVQNEMIEQRQKQGEDKFYKKKE